LLDNINLQGAKGVLVNITAGMDLAISEFEEVGDAIKSFTSDDATVIVGTVIDPELTGILKVTLVATGLDETVETVYPGDSLKSGSHFSKLSHATTNFSQRFSKKILANQPNAGQYQSKLNPIQTRTVQNMNAAEPKDDRTRNLDYLDIPAFLRRESESD
jgi:cell division protein FtsZ